MTDMMLFSGNATKELAERIANYLEIPLSDATISRFSDGEINIEINENVRGHDVFIIQSTCSPTNESLMELVIMADALRRASAGLRVWRTGHLPGRYGDRSVWRSRCRPPSTA